MFSNDIVGSDAFLEMPSTTQSLYFHLGMRCDDDGFVNPNVTMRMTGSNKNDLDILIAKKFLLPFKNGVVVIKHHRINNNWDSRDCRRTLYTEELKYLFIKDNNSYTLNEKKGESVLLKYPKRDRKIKELLPPTGTRREPADRIEENRIEENNLSETSSLSDLKTKVKEIKQKQEDIELNKKAIKFIEIYAGIKKVEVNKGFQSRHIKIAKEVLKYPKNKISASISYCKENYDDWGMETIIKVIEKGLI